MRQDGDAARLECRGAEDRFLAGMGEDGKKNGKARDTLHRLDNVLALAIGSAGVDDDNAARSDDKGDVRDASAILRRNLAATA